MSRCVVAGLLCVFSIFVSACAETVGSSALDGGAVQIVDVSFQSPPSQDNGRTVDVGVTPDVRRRRADLTPADGALVDALVTEDVPSQSVSLSNFAPMPDVSHGLVNVSANLEELMEYGALHSACAEFEADPLNERKKLLCGKYMFFYEGFDTLGVPRPIFDALLNHFPEEVGPGFSKLGLVPDPYSDKSYPLGFGSGQKMGGVNTLAWTCAGCHFGQLPDGRYAVGAPNHNYEYGTHTLSMLLLPFRLLPGWNEADHHPDAIERAKPILDKIDNQPGLGMTVMLNMMGIMGVVSDIGSLGLLSPLSYEEEEIYASFLSGTMDFTINPLPADDGVLTISKIIDLWDIPTHQEEQEYGMPYSMLAWTGSAMHLSDFMQGFVVIGGGDLEQWPPERIEPLEAYIRSLRSPKQLASAPPEQIAAGAQIFVEQGCLDCHDGPRGGGLKTYTFEEIGTDDAMKYWGDPEQTGKPCCGLDVVPDAFLTHEIKAPRLTGLWAKKRFLHNGSVGSLEDLLCRDSWRPLNTKVAYSDRGHLFGCDSLTIEQKDALISYLKSN